MSVYQQQEKLYPPITPPTTPQDDEYRLKKIDEIERFLRQEIKARDKLTKQFKRRATATLISDTSAMTAITILEVAFIATLTTGIGTPIGIILASTGLFLGLGSVVIHNIQKMFDWKARKHENIKTLAESKLNTISSIVSKAVKDSRISHQEYQLILKEVEHYRKMKDDIRTKSKKRSMPSLRNSARKS